MKMKSIKEQKGCDKDQDNDDQFSPAEACKQFLHNSQLICYNTLLVTTVFICQQYSLFEQKVNFIAIRAKNEIFSQRDLA